MSVSPLLSQDEVSPTSTPQQASAPAVALARMYGEPLFTLPHDLYIPPDALEIFLEAFEGPLDVLLYLIRKQNFNILDIPLADLTRQYLSYVEQVRSTNLELASDYLLMAAVLVEIKSRLLLPPRQAPEGGEAEDPRAELVRRLIDYEKMKLAAIKMDSLPLFERDFWSPHVHLEQAPTALMQFEELQPSAIRDAWLAVMQRNKLIQRHTITREALSVREHMSLVLRTLQGHRFMEFEALFNTRTSVPLVVVTFVAVLELARELLVEVSQAEAYAPIYVRLAYKSSH